MTKLTCPQCGGSHFAELEYKAYSGKPSTSTFGTGMMESAGIPFLICLCGWIIGPESPVRESRFALIRDSVLRACERQAAREDSVRGAADQTIAGNQLESCKQTLRHLSELVDEVIGNHAKDAK